MGSVKTCIAVVALVKTVPISHTSRYAWIAEIDSSCGEEGRLDTSSDV